MKLIFTLLLYRLIICQSVLVELISTDAWLKIIFRFIGNIRNLAMEKVASTIMFPCKYSSSGCTLSLLHTEKVEHEEMCEWRPYTCPCPGASCKWQGGLEQVMAHLMMSHKSITTLQGLYFLLILVRVGVDFIFCRMS